MVVVTRVEVDDAAVEVGDVRGHAVEEVAVVADDEEGPGPAQQELLQPDEALQVEVVGRLVHEEQVRLLQEQAGERHPHAPAAGELGDGALEVPLTETHTAKDGLSPGLELVAVCALEGCLQRPELVQQRVGVGGLGGALGRRSGCVRSVGVAGHACLVELRQPAAQLGDAMLGAEDVGIRRQDLVHDRVTGDLLDLLGQEADAQVLAGADLPPVQRHLPGYEPQHRGLSGAVGTHQSHAHAGLDVQARAVQDHLAAEGLGDVG